MARAPSAVLRATVLAGDVPVIVIGAGQFGVGHGVFHRAREFLPVGGPPLFRPDFLVERVPELVRRLLEFGDAFAERLAQFRELPRPEDNERDRENNDQFRETYISHITRNYTPESL